MCEFLLRVKDQAGNILSANYLARELQGDVICVQENDAYWGPGELGGFSYGDIQAHVDKYPNAFPIGTRYFIQTKDDGYYQAWDVLTQKTVYKFFPDRVQAAGIFPVEQDKANGNHNFWRLVKAPAISVAEMAPMLLPETPTVGLQNQVTQFRQFFIDKAKLVTNQAFLNHWNDDLRQQQTFTVPYTATQLKNSVVSKRKPVASAVAA